MKKYIFIFPILSVMGFTGCGESESVTDKNYENNDKEIIITRSENNGEISHEKGGLFMLKSFGEENNVLIDNAEIQTTSDGLMGVTPIYWPSDPDELDFFVYFPYVMEAAFGNSIPFEVEKDQSVLENFRKSTFYYAKRVVIDPVFSSELDLKFKSLMGKLTFICSPGQNVKAEDFNQDNIQISVENVSTKATIALENGTVNTAESVSSIQPYLMDADNSLYYELYLPSQDLSVSAKLNFTFKGKEMSATLPLMVESGRHYTLTVIVDEDVVGIESTIPDMPVIDL